MTLNKYAPIILATGIALSGCKKEFSLEDHCENTLAMHQLNGTSCDATNIESKIHCEQLIAQAKTNLMSACMTLQLNKPTMCLKTEKRFDCKNK